MEKHPEYEKADLLNRMVEPERMFTFRVCWQDDNGNWHTNTGYRCQFNGAIGPYKGGLRFQPNVTPSIMKFLGFEQTFKNSLTGKGFSYGGSLIRPEATGYGAVYYLENVLKDDGQDIKGKTIACAGFGNVTWGICKKATELGAKVVTLSGPDGYVYDPDGVNTPEKIEYLVTMRNSGRNKVQDYADKFGVEFFPGEKPWGVKVDICMPSAMQNDVHMKEEKMIAANHVHYYIEVANMPTTNDALRFLMDQGDIIVAPSKAVNAGGVATSALEMSQNSERLVWTEEEVDAQLHNIMNTIYKNSVEAAKRNGLGYNLVAGANIAGFERVAEAMLQQGVF